MIKRIVHQKCILPRTLRHLPSLGAQCLLLLWKLSKWLATFFYLFRFILVLVHTGTTQCGSLLLLRFFCGNFPSGPDSPWAAQFTPKWLSWVTEQSCMMITIPMSTLLLLHTEYDEVSPKSIQLLEYAIPLCGISETKTATGDPLVAKRLNFQCRFRLSKHYTKIPNL